MSDEPFLSPSRFPVSVIMQWQQVQHGAGSAKRWEVIGVVAGDNVCDKRQRRNLIRAEHGVAQYLWSGLTVVLHKEDVESYRYNLVASVPSLFVVCRKTQDGDMSPFLVMANCEEAGFYMEREGFVFSTPMPPEIYRWIEQYVVANYVPPAPTTRKHEKGKDHTRHE